MNRLSRSHYRSGWLLLAALAVTTFVYWPGLSGSWLFDDFPNIVENPGVQPSHVNVATLTRAALSSPSSEFKRPLASLSFTANYLLEGLHPFSWKLTNLAIHLINGALVFLLARMLLALTLSRTRPEMGAETVFPLYEVDTEAKERAGIIAVLIATAWLLLPINLTGVLYVVQRMESLANVFVLTGLIGYVAGRMRMLRIAIGPSLRKVNFGGRRPHGMWLCVISLVTCTALGITAKETVVMLPLYALLIEWILFGFRTAPPSTQAQDESAPTSPRKPDRAILLLFTLILIIPLTIGLLWLLPHVLSPETWASRDFTLRTRLLSEARIVVGYIAWSLFALPHWLSFYHDDYTISTGLLHPWTTLASIAALIGMIVSIFLLRRQRPLVSLGLALFLGCHLLTATILPLELIYEHRNYFASFGLLLALTPLFAVPGRTWLARMRQGVLAFALLAWTVTTATTAYAWGNSLRLAQDLAARAPDSPRAQYELGRSYIIASHYDPASPYTPMVYAPLERAAKLPDSSILPQQALIFFNARMHRPIKDAWWDTMIASLKRRKPGVQDESSLAALTRCAREELCSLSENRLQEAFKAAVSHPDTDARLWATYGDYAWNVMGNHSLGLRLTQHAVTAAPNEPAYHITLARMFIAAGQIDQANEQVIALNKLNIGGSLDGSIAALHERIAQAQNEVPE